MGSELKSISVEEFTTPTPITVSKETSIIDIKNLMSKQGIRHVPVVQDNSPIGIISDRDVLLAIRIDNETDKLTAKEVMTTEPYTVTPEISLEEVVFEMSKGRFSSAIVQYETGEIGLFTSTDALNALIEILRGLNR